MSLLDRLSEEQLVVLHEASSDRLRFASRLRRTLTIDGEDYSRFIDKEAGGLRYSGEDPAEGEPAALLEGWLSVPLPATGEESAELTSCEVDYYIGSTRYESFRGQIVWMDVAGGKTAFHAATAGYHVAGHLLERDLVYTNAKPSVALYEAIQGLPYDGVEISDTPDPPFTHDGTDKFDWTKFASEVTDAVRDEASLALVDTPLNVATGQKVGAAVSSAEAVAWTFTEGVDFDYKQLSVKPRREERYAAVVAWHESPATGERVPLARAKVDNRGRRVPQGKVLPVQMTEEDTERAQQRVFREALALSENDLSLEWPCVYPLFVVWTGDVVVIEGREITDTEVIVRSYRARIIVPQVDPEAKGSTFQAIGTQLGVRVEKRRKTLYVPTSPVTTRLWGLDYLGRLYFDESLPWVHYVEGEGLVLDEPPATLVEGEGVVIPT